jgi:hypothetical protein
LNDPSLDDAGRAIYANAQFQADVQDVASGKYGSAGLWASGASLGLAAIIIGGGSRGPSGDEAVVCPGCGTQNPNLLRSKGNNNVPLENLTDVGKDGLSAWCETCTQGQLRPKNPYWKGSAQQYQDAAAEMGLAVDKAAIPTPQYGGKGHFSLFVDAFGPDGFILPDLFPTIDSFIKSLPKIKFP